MAADGFLLAGLGTLILILLALKAAARFSGEDVLPMQWGFDGQVNWYAPRRFALSVIPIIGAAVLFGLAVKDYASATPALKVVPATLLLVCVHLFYVRLVDRTLSDRG